jgi:hypothetical protein
MSDSFLFQSKINKFQLLIFGTSITDAREYAKCTHPKFEMMFVSKNPSNVNPYVVCAITEKQVQLNRKSLNKMLYGDV